MTLVDDLTIIDDSLSLEQNDAQGDQEDEKEYDRNCINLLSLTFHIFGVNKFDQGPKRIKLS
jgi:hypothetical protein